MVVQILKKSIDANMDVLSASVGSLKITRCEGYLAYTVKIPNSFLVNMTSSGSISGELIRWLVNGELKTSYAAGAISSSNRGLIWFNNSGPVSGAVLSNTREKTS